MYCVIVGDIIRSKSQDSAQRSEATKAISRVLDYINVKYESSILASFGIVRGDAFEGVLFSMQYAPRIIQDIIKLLYEEQVRVRISAATGELSVVSLERNKADGQAFHTALEHMEKLRKNKSDHWFQVSMVTNTIVQPLLDGLLGLISALTKEWTERQTQIVWSMIDCGGVQTVVSRRMKISPSVVNKHLKAAHYEAYQRAWLGLEQYLTGQENAVLDPEKISPSYMTYYSIALQKAEQENWTDAAKFFDKSLAAAKKQFGETDPNLVPIYNALADAYLRQLSYSYLSKHDEEEILISAKQIIDASFGCQQALPKTNLEYARTLRLLGRCFFESKEYDKALARYTEATQIAEADVGVEHPFLYMCYGDIAGVYLRQKKYGPALDYRQKVLSYREHHKDHDLLSYATALHNIGVTYENIGQMEEALTAYQKTLAVFLEILPESHDYVVQTRQDIERITNKA